MMDMQWKRGLSAGIAVSFILAATLSVSADDGSKVAAFTTTLIVALLATCAVALVGWLMQRRRLAR